MTVLGIFGRVMSKLLSPRPRIHHCRTHWWGVTLVKLSSCCVFPGLTFPRSMGLLIKILVTSCCFFAWLLFNFSISAFLLNKKTFQKTCSVKVLFHVSYVLFLGKKYVSMAQQSTSDPQILQHLTSDGLITNCPFSSPCLVAEDVFENTWGNVRGQVQSHVCSIVVIYLSRILWKIYHQLVDIWSPSVDLVGLDDLFSPMVPWKMWGLQSQCFLEKLGLFPFLFKSYERKEDGAATFVSKLLVKNSLPKIAGGKVA